MTINKLHEWVFKKIEVNKWPLTHARNLIHLPPWFIFFLLFLWVLVKFIETDCMIDGMAALSSSGIGYSWTSTNCIGLWIVAFIGSSIRNCSDFHPGRFLLLLRQEVDSKIQRICYVLICSCQLSNSLFILPWLQSCWGTTCCSTSFRSGVTLTFLQIPQVEQSFSL